MLKIGLTGGIGSGKSTVAKIFAILGVPIYNADDASKRLMNEDEELKQNIKEIFGASVFKNEKLDNQFLAKIVFNNPKKLQQLNALVHPATIADADTWMQKQTSIYAIKEAALIFESGSQKYLDYVIGVQAPYTLRIQRTMHRNNITYKEVKERMDKQIDENIKMHLCDFVINNDEHELIIPQVIKLHEQLLAKAK